MSETRVLLKELRAAFAAMTVCVLVLSVLFANFAQAAGIKAPLHTHKAGAYTLCVEHLTHPADKASAPATGDERTRQHKCPACCLTALGAGFMPPRVANVTRPGIMHPHIVAYFAASPRQPASLAFDAANGARAPPA